MAIVFDDTEEIPKDPPKPALDIDQHYTGIAVDARRIPIESLLVHIEGSPWTVRYFSQILTDDSQVNSQQVNLPAVYQQYTAIEGFELKVTTPLNQAMNQPSGSFTVTGTATVYPYVIPNQGDMFIADIGDGRDGLFSVTTVERRTILKETCHEINYELVSYASGERIEDLNRKVIKTVYFKRDFLLNGQNPLLIESEVRLVESIEEHYRRLLTTYIADFYDREYRTLLVPEQSYTTYDHFLVKAFKAVFNNDQHPLIRSIVVMNCDGDDRMREYTFWDSLLQMDDALLPLSVQSMRTLRSREFDHVPRYKSIAYSGIRRLLYPTANPKGKAVDAPEKETPSIYPINQDAYYVFSEYFYRDLHPKSKLEVEVLKALKGDALSHATLEALARESFAWGALERFYYLPVLLILLKVSLRRL